MGVSLGSYVCIFFGIILLLDNTALTFYFGPQKHKQMRLLQFHQNKKNGVITKNESKKTSDVVKYFFM